MRPPFLLALLASLAVLGACASPPGAGSGSGGSGDAAAGGGTSQADDDLLVHVDRGDGTPADDWTLTCSAPVAGSHPQAEAACAHLAGLDHPFAALPDDVACTEVFGGPQTARVTGRWGGEPVDLELSRSNGCLIAQWDSLGPLLPIPVGVDPAG
jgi:hypothetical protein